MTTPKEPTPGKCMYTDKTLVNIPVNKRREFFEFLESLDADFRKTLAIAIDRTSVLYLDSLGVSAGKVRNRSQFLLDTTLVTRKQAFFQATIEEVQKINANT